MSEISAQVSSSSRLARSPNDDIRCPFCCCNDNISKQYKLNCLNDMMTLAPPKNAAHAALVLVRRELERDITLYGIMAETVHCASKDQGRSYGRINDTGPSSCRCPKSVREKSQNVKGPPKNVDTGSTHASGKDPPCIGADAR
ncbi:hypothetical protein TNCV_3126781 [Trichonephila clavipes]|nr:hypothetical protein TNCV_3126781 [Trichonephila clavipes]